MKKCFYLLLLFFGISFLQINAQPNKHKVPKRYFEDSLNPVKRPNTASTTNQAKGVAKVGLNAKTTQGNAQQSQQTAVNNPPKTFIRIDSTIGLHKKPPATSGTPATTSAQPGGKPKGGAHVGLNGESAKEVKTKPPVRRNR